MNTRHPSYGTGNFDDRPDAFVAWACQCRCHTNASAQAPGPARQRGAATGATPGADAPLPSAPGTIFTDDDLWVDDDTDWLFVVVASAAWLAFVLAVIWAVAS